MLFTNLEDAAGTTGVSSFFTNYGGIILLIAMIGLLYFFMIRPQKKQEKETANMRNNLKVNDEIVTIGGIVGIITNVSGKDTITIVTSRDKTRIQILRSAVSKVQVPAEDVSSEEANKQ